MNNPNASSGFDVKWLVVGGAVILGYLMVRDTFFPQSGSRLHIAAPQDEFFNTNIANEPGLVLVKFGADWCGPCKAMDSELEKYQQNKGAIKVVQVNVDHHPQLAQHYAVGAIPHTFLMKEGRVVADRIGGMSLPDIQRWVDSKSNL